MIISLPPVNTVSGDVVNKSQRKGKKALIRIQCDLGPGVFIYTELKQTAQRQVISASRA